ncbi:rod shape-determining protein RodA [Candidatus Daviesbacteria bacterium]|nr:rod shape-determining protein RodA [Candidatus Daviesbacteria bacterium]
MSKNFSFLPDLLITLPVILLLSLGILVIFSSDTQLAVQQLIFAIIGLLLYWFLSLIDFELYHHIVKYLYFAILSLLILLFLWGVETRGSVRWIPLGLFQFQPSEFAKPVLILFLAKFWSNRPSSWKNILLSIVLILPIAGLVFKQPDLGTALTLMAIWLVMLIGANISLLKLALMGVISAIITPIIWFFMQDYQKTRLLSFLSPNYDPLGAGYNAVQSMIAVGSGEMMGRGLGRGTQSRLQFLPEFRTDFIFASIAEEFGFFGSMIVLVLYGMLVGRIFKILGTTSNRFNNLLVMGVLGMLFFQVIVNIGMNIGVVPVTGITLPFLSYGGSSLISTLIALSFVSSAARFTRLG